MALTFGFGEITSSTKQRFLFSPCATAERVVVIWYDIGFRNLEENESCSAVNFQGQNRKPQRTSITNDRFT